jgi:tetratricopeptide (TPR) repeat protein
MPRLSQPLATAALLLVAGAAWATPLRPNADLPASDDQQYQACVALTQKSPDDAFEAAITWRDQGGGFPAKHCVTLALIALKQYAEAADRLEDLAREMHVKAAPLQADVLDQAANAWLLAGQTARAITVINAALDIKPQNVDFLIDRARAYAADNKYAEAAKDLDQALRLKPDRADALAFRASARRHLGNKAGALADAEAALALDGTDTAALLEHGLLLRDAGNKKGARQDWLKVILLAPNTPAADSAQADLEQMDLKAD